MGTVGSYGIVQGSNYYVRRHLYDMYPHGHISDLLLEAVEITEKGHWAQIVEGWTATNWRRGGWARENAIELTEKPSWQEVAEAERDWLEEPTEWGVFVLVDDQQLLILDFWDSTSALKVNLNDSAELCEVANSFLIGRPQHGELSKYATRRLRAAHIEMLEALGGDTDPIMPLSQLELHCGELQYGLMSRY